MVWSTAHYEAMLTPELKLAFTGSVDTYLTLTASSLRWSPAGAGIVLFPQSSLILKCRLEIAGSCLYGFAEDGNGKRNTEGKEVFMMKKESDKCS